jgi:hypothetical protein
MEIQRNIFGQSTEKSNLVCTKKMKLSLLWMILWHDNKKINQIIGFISKTSKSWLSASNIANQQSFSIPTSFVFLICFFCFFNFKALSNKKRRRIFIVIFHRATWNTKKTKEQDFGVQSNQAELIEIGQDIRFNCSIKTQRHSRAFVRKRRTLIYLNLDDMKIARKKSGRVLWQQMSKAMMIN